MPTTTWAAQISRTTLADGRDLLYFDAPGSPTRHPRTDMRDLPPRPETAQMRFDALSGEWISIATTRQHRAFLPPAELDPLAPQSAGNPSEVPDDYQVAVFENKSPSFGPTFPIDPIDQSVVAAPLGRTAAAAGRCEVICFSPESTGSFATQSARRARTVIEAWAHRTFELSAIPGVQQVFPFENRGTEIGVTLGHPHGQIYAYPYIPPVMQRICRAAEQAKGDLFAELLDFERNGPRVVLAGSHFTAYVPFAARWPVEIHLMPHRHVPDIAATSSEERDELASITLRLTRALDVLYGNQLPYIGAWIQAPVTEHRDDVRLHWRITSPQRSADKLKYVAGSESAMGAWIGDINPDVGAANFREALAKADEEHPVEPLADSPH